MTPSSESASDDQAVAVARVAFSEWLRAAREARGIALEEVARVTKIQIRTLEKLEEARFDLLPADVFVRGFLRNYARVVGLDAEQALARYDDCGTSPGPAAAAKARAMIETVAALAPGAAATVRTTQPRMLRAVATPPAGIQLAEGSSNELATVPMVEPKPVVVAEPVVEVAPVVVAEAAVAEAVIEDAPKPKRQRAKGTSTGKGRGKGRSKKKADVVEVVALQEPVVDDFEIEITPAIETAPIAVPAPAPVLVVPPPAFRPRVTGRGVAVTPIPSLVIDDDDPESAERVREARNDDKHEHRSFLPKALLDSERGRQGGLTLAVIILLIVATLTLSYLMRRPSAGGEGVTMIDSHATLV